jgi:hypothetical protein
LGFSHFEAIMNIAADLSVVFQTTSPKHPFRSASLKRMAESHGPKGQEELRSKAKV